MAYQHNTGYIGQKPETGYGSHNEPQTGYVNHNNPLKTGYNGYNYAGYNEPQTGYVNYNNKPETCYNGYNNELIETGSNGDNNELIETGSNGSSKAVTQYYNEPETQYIYFNEVVPTINYRQMNDFDEVQNRMRQSHEDQHGRSSSKYIESFNKEDYVDKRTGKLGLKAWAKRIFTKKYVDKEKGVTTKYEIECKVTKTTYPNKSSSKSDKNSSKSNNSQIEYH